MLPAPQFKHAKVAWIMVALMLGLLGAAYMTRGFRIYFAGPAGGAVGQYDLIARWTETHYVLRGKNPFDVAFAHVDAYRKAAADHGLSTARDDRIDPDLGIPVEVIYPPWSYAIMAPLFLTPYPPMVPIYAGLMALSIAAVMGWGYSIGRPFATHIGLALAMLMLAQAAWVGAIFVGNFPSLLTAALVGALLLLQRKRGLAAALLLTFVLLKPTFAGPFLLVLLVKRRFSALAVIAGLLIAGSLVTGWRVHTSPLEMFHQMQIASQIWVDKGYGPVQYLIHFGMPAAQASNIAAAAFSLFGAVLIFICRRAPYLTLFAIAGLISRLWSYHYYYDDCVLIFLLMAVIQRALATRSRFLWILSALCVLSLSTPASAYNVYSFSVALQILQQLIWCGTCAVLIIDALKNKPQDDLQPLAQAPVSGVPVDAPAASPASPS